MITLVFCCLAEPASGKRSEQKEKHMKVENKLVGRTLYIGLSGELDEHTAEYTRTCFEDLIDAYDMSKVVVELSELNFMDSTGIGVMIGRFKKLKARGIPLYIANPSNTVDKIFSLTGLYDIMPKIC